MDLQMFGSSSSTTQTYEPSEYELQLQKSQADYADAVAPNALYLNDVARQLLQDSIGTVQVDYDTLNDNAQKQIAASMGNLAGLTGSNNAAVAAANDTLANISDQYGQAVTNNYGRLEGLADQYGRAANRTNSDLSGYIGKNNQTTDTTNNTLYGLQNGYLPSQYQQNMEDSIRSALTRTVGENINSLGQRGVLNSSVTSSALNDIEKNAADAVAQQYLNNLNTVGGFAQQQYSNSMGNNSTNASLAQQQLANTNSALGSQENIYNTQYGQLTDTLGNQASLAQQQAQNALGANQTNAGIYESLIGNATAPISTAAAAQEAAQAPATNLWNASLGLNNSTTGALAAAAGKGTTTTTQSTGSGGFWSGLLGAGINAAAGSYGTLWCFSAGTKVLMADGTEKDIENVEEGDMVRSGSGENVKVIRKMIPHTNELFKVTTEDGHTTETTMTQPFLTEDGDWRLLTHILPGTVLKGVGKVKEVTRIGFASVFDLETDGENSYIVDGGFIAQGGSISIWGRCI